MATNSWVALIGPVEQKMRPAVSHYIGFPQEISPTGDAPRLLPRPDFLIVEETPEGFFLFRYTKSQDFGGDTWHQSLQEAKEQAIYEFGASLLEWKALPANIEDSIAYGAQLAAERSEGP